jgi:hypothetical protein
MDGGDFGSGEAAAGSAYRLRSLYFIVPLATPSSNRSPWGSLSRSVVELLVVDAKAEEEDEDDEEDEEEDDEEDDEWLSACASGYTTVVRTNDASSCSASAFVCQSIAVYVGYLQLGEDEPLQ